MVIETFLNLFLCYSSLQCNRIPYYSPKSYVESTLVGNSRQYTFKWCNDTVQLPKVYMNDVCRCVPERFYSVFMVIKDEIRKGRFNGFKMNCTQVFNTTDDDSSTIPQNAEPSKISTALAQLLRQRGVGPLEIARIQALGLSEAELERLRARRKLTLAEIAFMQRRGVPMQQINAFQISGLLPSQIRALRARGQLPPVGPAIPTRGFIGVTSNSAPGGMPQVTPIRPINLPAGRIAPRIGVPPIRQTGRRIIGTPIVTPIRPVGTPTSQRVIPQAPRRITKFQELQLLSRQFTPLQLVLQVRQLSIDDLTSIQSEMTDDQFAAMWKILTEAQKQQLFPRLPSQRKDRLTSPQTSQESLRAFQNLLTPSQIMQLSAGQMQRLGAYLAAMDGDKSQLPKGLLPTSNGGDATTDTGAPFRHTNPTTVIGTGPSTTGNTVVDSAGSTAPNIGTIVISGENIVGDGGSVPSTGTGSSTIDTSGTVVDSNLPDPPSPDLQLTSGSLVVDSPTVDNAYQPTGGESRIGTSGSGSSNTATNTETGSTYAEGGTESGSTYTEGGTESGSTYAESGSSGTDTNTILPNYNIVPGTETFPPETCRKCEESDRKNACFLPHPASCNMFIQCVTASGTKLRPQPMKCYDFTFWDQSYQSCVATSEHCTMPTGVESLPKGGIIEAPVEYDNTPAQVSPTTTTQPPPPTTTGPPPDYAPFERVHATVEMSLFPAPPSGQGLTIPDDVPPNLEFTDINTARRGFLERVNGPEITVAENEPFNIEIPTTTTASTPASVKTSPTPIPVKAPPAEVCELGWLGFERDCYFFSSDKRTWHSALTRCHNMGGHLARIYTTAENKFIQNTARNRKGTVYDGYWLGGSDIRNEGVWEWHETRKAIGPVFWHQSEPNSFQGDQDCLQLFVHHGFQWDDEVCTNERHYVCEKPAKFD